MEKGNFCKSHHRVSRNTLGRILLGKPEDVDMRVIISRAVPEAQPALSFKKPYERDSESLENRHLRAKWTFNREISKGKANVVGSLGSTQERAGSTCCSCLETSGITHAVCQQASDVKIKKPHLSPSNLWGHHFHLLNAPATQPASSVASLCKSPNMQNTIAPSKQHHKGNSKDLLKPVRNVPVGGRKKWNYGKKGIAVA